MRISPAPDVHPHNISPPLPCTARCPRSLHRPLRLHPSRGCSRCTKNAPKSWAEEPHLDGVSLPDDPDDFDYNEFVDREFGRSASIKPPHLAWKWWLTAIILLALMITGLISNW